MMSVMFKGMVLFTTGFIALVYGWEVSKGGEHSMCIDWGQVTVVTSYVT